MQYKWYYIEGKIGIVWKETSVWVYINWLFGVSAGIHGEVGNGDGGEILPVTGIGDVNGEENKERDGEQDGNPHPIAIPIW